MGGKGMLGILTGETPIGYKSKYQIQNNKKQ